MRKKPYEMLHLGFLAHMHRKLCEQRFLSEGLTRGMPYMLDFLKDHSGCIQRDLARRWHLDPATVTSVMTIMENEGYVRRLPMPADKRALQVSLTPLGEEKARLVDETHALFDKRCFEGFTPEEKAAFKQMLGRIEENLKTFEAKPEKTTKEG